MLAGRAGTVHGGRARGTKRPKGGWPRHPYRRNDHVERTGGVGRSTPMARPPQLSRTGKVVVASPRTASEGVAASGGLAPVFVVQPRVRGRMSKRANQPIGHCEKAVKLRIEKKATPPDSGVPSPGALFRSPEAGSSRHSSSRPAVLSYRVLEPASGNRNNAGDASMNPGNPHPQEAPEALRCKQSKPPSASRRLTTSCPLPCSYSGAGSERAVPGVPSTTRPQECKMPAWKLRASFAPGVTSAAIGVSGREKWGRPERVSSGDRPRRVCSHRLRQDRGTRGPLGDGAEKTRHAIRYTPFQSCQQDKCEIPRIGC